MAEPLISYYHNLKKVAGNISIDDVIQTIRTGTLEDRSFSDLITQIRNEPDKDKRNDLKRKLPKVTVSGTFDQERVTGKFAAHSGYIQIDVDELPEWYKSFEDIRTIIELDKYTFACFYSPSNKLKLIVRIPAEQLTHLASFLALEQYYHDKYKIQIDRSTKDVARLCYLSYDPGIFVNAAADVYVGIPDAQPKPAVGTAKKIATVKNPQSYPTNDKAADVENCVNQIERAAIDITGTYQDWIKIGFALAEGLGEAGREYYQRISRFYAGYDHDKTDKQYSACIKGTGSSKVQLASFFQACKDYGIDTRSPRKDSSRIPAVQPKVLVRPGNEQIEDLKKPIPPDCENKDGFLSEHDFYYAGSCYYAPRQTKTKTFYERISNFVMEFMYFFPDGTNNARWYIKFQHHDGQMKEIELSAKDLNTLSSFKAAIMSHGRFTFLGTQPQLDKIIEYHNNEYKEAHKIHALGWQADHDIYAYSNGVIDRENNFIPANVLGIVTTDEKSYYLPALSELTKNDTSYLNERKFIYRPGALSFADYNKYIYQAYGVNGAIGNAYLIASIFRDIIFNVRASFPYLFLFGEAGAGKTTFTDLHLSVFGLPQPGIGISNDSTSKSIARRISQFKNALTYIKEYTNNDVADSTIGLLKTGYEGVGYDRAQTSNDNKTHQTGVYSGVFIDGNELPEKNNALFSRTVQITFEKSDFTTEQTAAFNILKDEAEKGFGQIFAEIWKHRKVVSEKFGEMYRKVVAYLKSERCRDMFTIDRTVEHIALLIAPIRILEPYLKFHTSTDEIINVLIAAARDQNEAMKQSNEIFTFFSAIEFLSHEHKIRDGMDYHITNNADGVEVLTLALNRVYPTYVEHCNKQKSPAIGKASLIRILKNKPFTIKSTQKDAEYAGVDKVLKKRAWKFVYAELQIEVHRNIPSFI